MDSAGGAEARKAPPPLNPPLIAHVVSHPLNMNLQPYNGARPLKFGLFTYFDLSHIW